MPRCNLAIRAAFESDQRCLGWEKHVIENSTAGSVQIAGNSWRVRLPATALTLPTPMLLRNDASSLRGEGFEALKAAIVTGHAAVADVSELGAKAKAVKK